MSRLVAQIFASNDLAYSDYDKSMLIEYGLFKTTDATDLEISTAMMVDVKDELFLVIS